MKISAKEQHGLRAMDELAARYGQGPVPLGEVADAQGISRDYLEQIVDLESDRFMNLDYDEPGFRTEAGAILGEYGNNAGSAGFPCRGVPLSA